MLKMTDTLAHQIERHGIRSYPEECCGMMLGSNNDGVLIVDSIIEIDNSQGENRARRFLITPRQYLQAERTAAEKHLELLGFYHSHPDHPAIPSAFDTEHALPFFTYIIVSIMNREPKTMTAWLLSEDRSHMAERPFVVETAQVDA